MLRFLNLRITNRYERLEDDDRWVIALDFSDMPEKLKGEYLDVYEGVRSGILYTIKFEEKSNLGTAYLGRVNISRSDKIKVEENFQYQNRGYTMGKL